jgi:hypothetical protein
MRTWEGRDPDFGRPVAAPLEQCAELLGVDLATVREVAANVEPYIRADGTRIWSLTQLEATTARDVRPAAGRLRRPATQFDCRYISGARGAALPRDTTPGAPRSEQRGLGSQPVARVVS